MKLKFSPMGATKVLPKIESSKCMPQSGYVTQVVHK